MTKKRRSKPLFANSRNFEVFFDLDRKKAELNSLNTQLSSPDTWQDQKKFQSLQQAKKRLERDLQVFQKMRDKKEEIEVLLELSKEGENVAADLAASLSVLEKDIDDAEMRTLYFDIDDPRNAIMTIHPGAGGTESQDWAQILFRMYLRYAERKGYKAEIFDSTPGEEAGLKSATVRIEGDYAFGNLSQETGVHRLVRISPFDANKRRHTTFSAVFVMPEIDDAIAVDIRDEDLKLDFFRSGGKGGQNVNKVETAVRITHIPTNIVVQCQNERSQHKNKAAAMKVLKSRIYDIEKKKKMAKVEKLEDSKSDIAWGNQIRSYVLQPYRMIKDMRTRVETGDVDKVLDGDLDEFIKASLFLRKKSTQDPAG